ncbi:hypothetical protein ElyMa_001281700 [Elysia marginata]|uniref:Uncharacterized protein n=1 Tax=Elysia marginata TaxID=1093978 RepID=A0AAV4IFE9_9GAST|nr:hypothetical protein ElyMa_001281700 [Elysia marginata]
MSTCVLSHWPGGRDDTDLNRARPASPMMSTLSVPIVTIQPSTPTLTKQRKSMQEVDGNTNRCVSPAVLRLCVSSPLCRPSAREPEEGLTFPVRLYLDEASGLKRGGRAKKKKRRSLHKGMRRRRRRRRRKGEEQKTAASGRRRNSIKKKKNNNKQEEEEEQQQQQQQQQQQHQTKTTAAAADDDDEEEEEKEKEEEEDCVVIFTTIIYYLLFH